MREAFILRLTAVLSASLCWLSTESRAAAGDLDTTFNGVGYVLTQIDVSNSDYGWAMAIQPDQKIVVAGECLVQGDTDFCLTRYLPNGSLDTTFGTNGIRTATVGSVNDRGRAMVIQADGKIIVGGGCDSGTVSDFCLMRFTATGSIDTTFGTNGRVMTDVLGGADQINALALTPDGKIVAAGDCASGAVKVMCVARYLSGGALDTSFSGDGKYSQSFSAGNNVTNALVVQGDNRIFVGLTAFEAGNLNSTRQLQRISAAGVAEVSAVLPNVDPTPIDSLWSMAQQPDGSLIVAGLCEYAASTYGTCAVRRTSGLSADNSFANDAVGYGATDVSAAYLTLQGDGKVLVARICRLSTPRDQICLDRFHSDGKFDSGFGVGGTATAVLAGSTRFKQMRAVAVQADGKIVLAGACESAAVGPVRFCVARFDGGPIGYRACTLDVDGDLAVHATTDTLIMARVALGLTGTAVVNGINFPAGATRTTWSSIRSYLVNHCGMNLAP